MPLMQEDIRQHYEEAWKKVDESARDDAGLVYSSPVEDAVLYPIYQRLISDLQVKVEGGKVLDVGSGSGRWVRFFTKRFTPSLLMGVDFAAASVELLKRRYTADNLTFRAADITDPTLELGERFDLINIMNVLFHIPEQDRFASALKNLAKHLGPGGRIVTTEYMPRTTMRTNWMLVRSRYDMEQLVAAAGLRIVEIRAHSIFSNDPMGLDGPDAGIRNQFNIVRNTMIQVLASGLEAPARDFYIKFFGEIESSILNFCKERIAEVDMPSQKLVVLAAK
jgi:SAM-dependent methyltransferase